MNKIIDATLGILAVFAFVFVCIMSVVFQKDNQPYVHEFKVVRDTVVYSRLHNVTVTTYFAVKEQCDMSPFITADGSEIDSTSKNWCAISQDLLEFFDYGDTIHVKIGDKEYDGHYIVHDCMNSRVKNCVDILIPPGDKRHGGLWKGEIKWKDIK